MNPDLCDFCDSLENPALRITEGVTAHVCFCDACYQKRQKRRMDRIRECFEFTFREDWRYALAPVETS